jgi:hypothetical protein
MYGNLQHAILPIRRRLLARRVALTGSESQAGKCLFKGEHAIYFVCTLFVLIYFSAQWGLWRGSGSCFSLMQIRIRIRIKPFALMRIQILPFTLMWIWIRLLPLNFFQTWTLHCSKITLQGCQLFTLMRIRIPLFTLMQIQLPKTVAFCILCSVNFCGTVCAASCLIRAGQILRLGFRWEKTDKVQFSLMKQKFVSRAFLSDFSSRRSATAQY